jgi:hypothetical protein
VSGGDVIGEANGVALGFDEMVGESAVERVDLGVNFACELLGSVDRIARCLATVFLTVVDQ